MSTTWASSGPQNAPLQNEQTVFHRIAQERDALSQSCAHLQEQADLERRRNPVFRSRPEMHYNPYNERYFTLAERFAARMGWPVGSIPDNLGISCLVVIANEPAKEVAVFLVHNDKPLVMTDEETMFPSDGLIARLRLLCG